VADVAGLRLTEVQGRIPFEIFPTHAAGRAWASQRFAEDPSYAFYMTAPYPRREGCSPVARTTRTAAAVASPAINTPTIEEEPLWDTETKPAEPVTDWEV